MKNNLVIKFDIDVDVKILFDNNIIGESGYKDTFETIIDKDGLLTIKHGMKKANIRVLKEKQNNISVTYSTSGQLKATFMNNISSNKKEQEETPKENNNTNISTNTPLNNNVQNSNTNSNSTTNNNNNVVGGIVSFIILAAVFYGIYSLVFNYSSSSSSSKINGCYYITNHLYEGRGTKLCIEKSTVAFTVEGSTVNLYPEYIGNNLYIKNEYDDTLFRCTASKENNTSIQCYSSNKAIGTGTYIWKKN